MILKEEKGFAATDIAISVIVVTIFIAMLGSLIVNININSTAVERKTKATSYAVQEIETIKALGISEYIDKGITEEYVVEQDIKENGSFSGYHKTIKVKDYVLIKKDNTKEKNIVKEVTVEISYKIGNKENNVTLSTYITKE